ncbi:MAG: hypothetical protein ACLPX9_17215 [Rhodomicrobium sp.]
MFRILMAALAVIFLSAGLASAGEWVPLGEAPVGFRNDYTTIEVGRREGKFHRLRLKVRKNEIKLNSIKVFFSDGQVEPLPYEQLIPAGGEAEIPLPGGWHGRHIHKVELHYHTVREWSDREAFVVLEGRED